MSVRERAIRAWRGEASREQNRLAMLQQMETAIEACRRATEWFGKVPHRVHICYYTVRPFVEYDDLELYYAADGFHLKCACPDCGQAVYSLPFKSLQALGKLLHAFRPANHTCPKGTAYEQSVGNNA